MEKNSLEKVRKHVFYKHVNIFTKNGGKNGKKIFFQKHTDFASKQRWKKIVSKSAKLRFLKTHIYCDQKMGGKKTREIIFFRNTHISQTKNDGNNRLEKVRKHVFL